jgi:hypothetical protein
MLIDLCGQRFGRLIVLRRGTKKKLDRVYWLCRCDCSRRKQIRGDSLRAGSIKSCGCLPRGYAPEQIVGQRFGRLTAIQRVDSTSHRHGRWLCQCRCGRRVIVRLDQLRDRTTKSCSCWYQDSRPLTIKHGHARIKKRSVIYSAYQRQKSWCRNPRDRHYPTVGRRAWY